MRQTIYNLLNSIANRETVEYKQLNNAITYMLRAVEKKQPYYVVIFKTDLLISPHHIKRSLVPLVDKTITKFSKLLTIAFLHEEKQPIETLYTMQYDRNAETLDIIFRCIGGESYKITFDLNNNRCLFSGTAEYDSLKQAAQTVFDKQYKTLKQYWKSNKWVS